MRLQELSLHLCSRALVHDKSVAVQALPAEYSAHRKQWVNIIMQGCVAFHFKEEVMHDGVLLLDRTMASKHAPSVNMLPLTAAACLLISAQQGSPSHLLKLSALHLPSPRLPRQILQESAEMQ